MQPCSDIQIQNTMNAVRVMVGLEGSEILTVTVSWTRAAAPGTIKTQDGPPEHPVVSVYPSVPTIDITTLVEDV